jgi:hypothetical protein
MSEYAYRVFVGILFIKIPVLNLPWVRPFAQFAFDLWLKPAFAVLGTVIDFKIIDYEVAIQDEEYKEIVLEIKAIEESDKPIEEYDPKEIQQIRDRFHEKLDKLIKHPSSYTGPL